MHPNASVRIRNEHIVIGNPGPANSNLSDYVQQHFTQHLHNKITRAVSVASSAACKKWVVDGRLRHSTRNRFVVDNKSNFLRQFACALVMRLREKTGGYIK